MKYSEWLKRRDENRGAGRVGISDIGPDSHHSVPDGIDGKNPGAFGTFSLDGSDLPPTNTKKTRMRPAMYPKKNCNCGK